MGGVVAGSVFIRYLSTMFGWKTSRERIHVLESSSLHVLERLDSLERRFKAVDLEWSATYDNFRRLMAKLAKRARALENPPEETAEDAPGPTNGRRVGINPLAARLLRGSPLEAPEE
ncbi:MAG: hypothetical protein L0214_15015 [candidate division NC10 bacterium]|nr:hypothetical protein [candidate division NC10 bacterium]